MAPKKEPAGRARGPLNFFALDEVEVGSRLIFVPIRGNRYAPEHQVSFVVDAIRRSTPNGGRGYWRAREGVRAETNLDEVRMHSADGLRHSCHAGHLMVSGQWLLEPGGVPR